MSVSDKKYWSQRVQELANSVKPVSDTDFFSSDAYREFTENAAKDMISGVCGYLRSIGYKISEKEESERVDELTVVMLADANMTACTTGDTVLIGVDGDLVNYFDSRELRHYAIQGLRVHEMGHVLFTNFQNMKMWHDKLSKGIWWPEKPQRISTPEGTELTDIMQKPEYVSSFVSIAKNIENSIEDGFIEREIRSMYGGLASTELATINDALISKSRSFGETLKKSSPFEAMMEQVLLYAKFDFTMTEDMPSEYDDIFDECIELIDDCKYERDSLKRLKGVNELCCAMYPLLKDFIKKETKMDQSAGGGDSGSPSGGMGNSGSSGQNGSSGDKSQSQNGNGNNQQNQNDSIQNIPQSALQKALQKAAKAAQKAANRAGATKEGDRDSQSITDKGARSKEAKDYSNGKQASSESGTGRTDHNNVSHEKGSSTGQPDLGAATMDLKSIENQRKIEVATEQANEELNAQLKKEAAEMRKTVGTRLEVTRAEKVSDSNAMPASDGTPYMSGEGATQTTVDATPESAGQATQVVIDATAPTDNDSAVTDVTSDIIVMAITVALAVCAVLSLIAMVKCATANSHNKELVGSVAAKTVYRKDDSEQHNRHGDEKASVAEKAQDEEVHEPAEKPKAAEEMPAPQEVKEPAMDDTTEHEPISPIVTAMVNDSVSNAAQLYRTELAGETTVDNSTNAAPAPTE